MGCRSSGLGVSAPDVEDYFDLSQPHEMIRLDQLVLRKPAASQPASVANAEQLMERARRSEIPRRGPISVARREDGRFDVIDGNATTAVLISWDWALAPVREVPEPLSERR